MSPLPVHLVQIPALGCNAELYIGIEPALTNVARISTLIPTANRYELMVQDVLANAPSRFVVMGTSMGGRLALETTLAAPDRVAGLIIIGSGPGAVADPAAGLRRSARIRGGEFEQVLTEMGDMISHLPGPNGPSTMAAFKSMARNVGAEITASQSDALAYRVDRSSALNQIKCPTLLLWGREDKFSPFDDALRMNAVIIGSRCAMIPNCGHFPTLEYPERAAEIIRQWLKDSKLI